jgi:tetratricopeptide (TPR) repeat protein
MQMGHDEKVSLRQSFPMSTPGEMPTDPVARASALIAAGRASEAVAILERLVAQKDAGLGSLSALGRALKAAGRHEDALAAYQRAVRVAPASAVAEHNVAGVLGDLARHAEAESAARRAFAKGLDAAETWLVLARALQGQARLDEAEAAYRECLRRRHNDAAAHRDYAQLLWMRTGDAGLASSTLDAAIRADPAQGALAIVKSKVLQFAGDDRGAYDTLAAAIGRTPLDTTLLCAAVFAAGRAGLAEAGLEYAKRALVIAPGDARLLIARAQAQLAMGNAQAAAADALEVRGRLPLDQHVIAILATAWRLLGDPRYGELYDYSAFVLSFQLAVPPGWIDLAAYLADLGNGLVEFHAYRSHPFDQSLRGGSQAPDLLTGKHPAVRALPEALDPALRQALGRLGTGSDPVRARNVGGYRFAGIWSVRLGPGGRHVDHVHPAGWLSSACYVDLPELGEERGGEGWIKFGEPGVPTRPTLQAEHYERPEPGKLVIFPSYMWHGTVPFRKGAHRLTFAFDLLPA